MTAGERLRRRLNATQCFRLTGTTSADWETDACAVGLEELQQEMDDLLAGLFPATSTGAQLDFWEARYRPDPLEAEESVRREMLLARAGQLTGTEDPEAQEEWTRLMIAAGVKADVVADVTSDESPRLLIRGAVHFRQPKAQVERELDQLLPAHLPWAWSDTLTWRGIEEVIPSMLEMDRQYQRWSGLDSMKLSELIALFP